MLEAEQMPLLGRGVRCYESCVLGRCWPPPRGAFGLTGRAAGSAATGGQPVGLMDRSDMAGVLPDVHLPEHGEQGGQHRLLAGAASAVRAGEEPDHPDGSLGPGQAGCCPRRLPLGSSPPA